MGIKWNQGHSCLFFFCVQPWVISSASLFARLRFFQTLGMWTKHRTERDERRRRYSIFWKELRDGTSASMSKIIQSPIRSNSCAFRWMCVCTRGNGAFKFDMDSNGWIAKARSHVTSSFRFFPLVIVEGKQIFKAQLSEAEGRICSTVNALRENGPFCFVVSNWRWTKRGTNESRTSLFLVVPNPPGQPEETRVKGKTRKDRAEHDELKDWILMPFPPYKRPRDKRVESRYVTDNSPVTQKERNHLLLMKHA